MSFMILKMEEFLPSDLGLDIGSGSKSYCHASLVKNKLQCESKKN